MAIEFAHTMREHTDRLQHQCRKLDGSTASRRATETQAIRQSIAARMASGVHDEER
jgi:hypothetical protein